MKKLDFIIRVVRGNINSNKQAATEIDALFNVNPAVHVVVSIQDEM